MPTDDEVLVRVHAAGVDRRHRGQHPLAQPDYHQTSDRYDIAVTGGADTLTLDTS